MGLRLGDDGGADRIVRPEGQGGGQQLLGQCDVVGCCHRLGLAHGRRWWVAWVLAWCMGPPVQWDSADRAKRAVIRSMTARQTPVLPGPQRRPYWPLRKAASHACSALML